MSIICGKNGLENTSYTKIAKAAKQQGMARDSSLRSE
jgi:hypothetical protein